MSSPSIRATQTRTGLSQAPVAVAAPPQAVLEPAAVDSPAARKAATALMLLMLVSAAALFAPLVPSQRFSYDEADYAYAASKGFVVHYLDRGAISAAEFVRKGKQATEPANWPVLSEYIRNTGDISFYRHYHGPLYLYSLILAKHFFGMQERRLRLVSLASLLLSTVALFAGCLFTVPRHAPVAACLAAFFLLASPTIVQTALWLGPHTLYAATVTVALTFMAKMLQRNETRYLYASVVTLAVAFTAIEYALLLLLTCVLVVWFSRRALFVHCSAQQKLLVLVRCAALYLCTIAVIWPAGVFKLTLAKNYLFFLYFTVVRSAWAYGTGSLAQVWWLRMRNSPLEFTCLLFFAGAYVWTTIRKRDSVFLLPFAVYALLMILTTVRNRSQSPQYLSSLLPPLFFIGAAMLASTLGNRGRAARALIIVVVLAFAANGYVWSYRPLSRPRPDPLVNGIVEVFQRAGVRNVKVVVPHDYLPTLHFYFPLDEYVPYPDAVSTDRLLPEIAASNADGLVYVGPELQQVVDRLPRDHAANIITGSGVSARAIAYVPLR